MRSLLAGITVCAALLAPSAIVAAETTAAAPEAAEGPVSASVLTNAALISVKIPKSIFSSDPAFGVDPFNPNSTRRTEPDEPAPEPMPEEPEPKKTGLEMNPKLVDRTVSVDDTGLDFLSIKGIIATARSRTVTLDTTARTYVFRSGDEIFVRIPDDKRLRIRCVEIRRREAVFKLADRPEPVVLKMR